jgi:carboxymethylenebutenolidase
MGNAIELTASDGFRLSAYRADPAGKPRGGMVVVQEIFGVNSHVRSVCDGYAADGYIAIAPALFDRAERGVDIGYTADDMTRGRGLMSKVTMPNALLDVSAARDVLAKSVTKIGIVGYCWGGTVSWMAAAHIPGIAAAVTYYGGGILNAANEKPACPVMMHFGEKDGHIPAAGVREFAAKHPDIQVFLYPADHGFNCDQRGSYDPSAAKLARERTLTFLRQHVG